MTQTVDSLDLVVDLEQKCRVVSDFIPLRAKQFPNKIALRQFNRKTSSWYELSYSNLHEKITLWRKALAASKFPRGSRVGILLNNSIDAVLIDQAVLANGYVPVPMHAIDTPRSSAFLLSDSSAVCFVTNKFDRWEAIERAGIELPLLQEVLLTEEITPAAKKEIPQLYGLEDWIARANSVTELPKGPTPEDLAAIVYTSGTTGRPKGVMLTHKNIVSNVLSCLHTISPLPYPDYTFLSFLPLSHTFERTAGYYMPLAMSNTISFNRSIMLLNEDLKIVRPHMLISVPRIYERIALKIKDSLKKESFINRFFFNLCVSVGWRVFCRNNKLPVPFSVVAFLDNLLDPWLKKLVARKVLAAFGGRLQLAIAGGAALSPSVARLFAGLGLNIVQGYGMTECTPVISVNRLGSNDPKSVGEPLVGVNVRIDPTTKEIQVKADSVMKGYWQRSNDTAQILHDGWLSTGDTGEIDENGRLHIQGRIKEIIVTSTGEKIPPVDLELALESDPLFSQAYVLGEDRPFVTFITVVNPEEWKKVAEHFGVDPQDPEAYKIPVVRTALMRRAKTAAAGFPHYALPRSVIVSFTPWTVDNGFLTPTLKLKRKPLYEHFKNDIDAMYAVHE